MGGSEWVELTTDKERWQKLMLIHQGALSEFQG